MNPMNGTGQFTLEDRLLQNLAEVDKSLRWSYYVLIIVCILFLYQFFTGRVIEIPVIKLELNRNFTFRIGPLAILLIQLFISSYFRHRLTLIRKLKSIFDTHDPAHRVATPEIHLLFWPWLLNFPFLKPIDDQKDRQIGASIIEIILLFFQFLPAITIGVIAVHPVFSNTTGSHIAIMINWLFTVLPTCLLILTVFQVRYSRQLDRQISEILEWKKPAQQLPEGLETESTFEGEFVFVLLLIGGFLSNINFRLFPYWGFDLTVVPAILTIIVGYRYGKVRACVFGTLIAGLYIFITFSSRNLGKLLYDPFVIGPITLPHSSLYNLILLALLGYFSGWLFQQIRLFINKAGISIQGLDSQTVSPDRGKLRNFFLILISAMVILLTNITYKTIPGGLSLVVCFALGFRLGPRIGVWSGVVAMIMSIVLHNIQHAYGLPFLMYASAPGHILAFAFIGRWSGRIGLMVRHSNILTQFKEKLSLHVQANVPIQPRDFLFIFALVLFSVVYFIEVTDSIYIRLITFYTVIVMLFGTFCGSKRAAWLTGITMTTIYIIGNLAGLLEGNNLLKFTVHLRPASWGAANIIIFTLAAYISGRLYLIENKKYQYLIAVGVFAAFQLSAILHSGFFLSPKAPLMIQEKIRFGLLTPPAKLLEPWLITILFSACLKLFHRKYRIQE